MGIDVLVRRENAADIDLTPRQVIGYIEELAIELADLAAKHGRTELAASLSIVAVQAGGERRRCEREAH